ncbi:MAG: carboxylating nicotinate-nucleotide diphosphorylase [Planctomycetes bacterium]|nr:carboxylating nicotinate-nucleotide diphosphorylase [Planctomycetota bacterium]
MELPAALVDDLVRRALGEDLGPNGVDLTTAVALRTPRRARARIVAKSAGVLAGLPLALAAFSSCDPAVHLVPHRRDGERVERGGLVLEIAGDAAALLRAERSALNFLQQLSGIATLTRAFVDAVAGTGAAILDTRKTSPGLRAVEKYAVRMGGGTNHRFGLFDQILLKENHFACAAPESVESVVARAVARSPAGVPVVAEARDLGEALAAVRGGAQIVMLDNFELGTGLRDAVRAVRGEAARLGRRVALEISGGIVLDNVAAYAACGVDRISVGALTHSAKALDLSLLVEIGAVAPEAVR